jgi:superfamily II DNA or RNA helicase
MPEPRVLRPYQVEAAGAVLNDWTNGIRRVGVVLPTGAGKSTVIGALVQWAWHNDLRVVLLAHRAELLDQMIRDTKAVAPEIPDSEYGIVRAEHDDHHCPIVAATFQTLAGAHRREALGRRDMLLVDETHHIVATGFHATFEELGGYDGALMCGFTATLFRDDNRTGRAKSRGLGDVIEKVSYERDLRWAIEAGFLIKPTGLTVRIEALNQLNKVRNVAGDFHQGQLAEVMEAAVEYTVDAVELHAGNRRSIIFGASVAACERIVEMLNERGNLRAALIVGSMNYEERQPVYADFRNGDIDAMVTVQVLSEGADFPSCDCVVMGRPTRSRVLYSQMIGRALRPYPGKTDALVLDLSGSTRQMKLVHLSELTHGIDIDLDEVDEDGEAIDPSICTNTGENVLTCMCADCVADRAPIGRAPAVQRQGIVDMTPIDLIDGLAGDDTLWLQTPAGVLFIPLRDGWIVFLWPEDGIVSSTLHAVGLINTRSRKASGGFVAADGSLDPDHAWAVYQTLDIAVKSAQQWIVDHDIELPSKRAPWRVRNQPPSEMQVSMARRLGIPGYEGMTKGKLSDEISIVFAARVLDHAIETEN